MTYVQDLTPNTYHGPRNKYGALAVGWLDKEHPFTAGDTSQEFKDKLRVLVEKQSVMHYMGSHECQWCPRPSQHMMGLRGNGSIIVVSPTSDITYEAPVLIHHYVTEHNYLPPQDFITAVLFASTT